MFENRADCSCSCATCVNTYVVVRDFTDYSYMSTFQIDDNVLVDVCNKVLISGIDIRCESVLPTYVQLSLIRQNGYTIISFSDMNDEMLHRCTISYCEIPGLQIYKDENDKIVRMVMYEDKNDELV